MGLYHFSEQPGIGEFVPRAPLAHPDAEPLVWAIDAEHAPLYYLPADCPRVCFWPLPTTTAADVHRIYEFVTARMVIAIESAWLPRVAAARLYRYTFDPDGFEDCHDHGVHVSRRTVRPLREEPVGDLLHRLAESDVELRVCPSLLPIANAVIESTLHFSLIRMRSAAGWTGPPGTPTVPPEIKR